MHSLYHGRPLYLVLVLYLLATFCDASNRQRRNIPTLRPGGRNVCSFDETKTIYELKYTTITETRDTEVCCRNFLRCWKKCKRTSVINKQVSKLISRLVTYKIHHCCSGYSVNQEGTECTRPVCFPPCKNGGNCVKPDQCQCAKGFEGTICQFDRNECLIGLEGYSKCKSMEIGNQGSSECINIPGSFYCACKRGFTPYQNKNNVTECKNIDECKKKPCKCAPNIPNCHQIATCTDLDGSYQCSCGHGYRLARDNMCVDRNECFENANICPQVCQNTIGSYQCKCFAGFKWMPDQKKCKAKDLCQYGGGCEHTCYPIYAGKVCLCRSGYSLSLSDRHSCNDINECTLSNPCDLRTSHCENYEGGYRCVCKKGYLKAYNGLLCLDRNECVEKTASCEQKCDNTVGGYRCLCNVGFRLKKDAKSCEDIDECESRYTNRCTQRCINTIGSYACACDPGYLLGVDKRTCYARKCEAVTDPFFGEASCEGYIVGKKCQFTCLNGFELVGSKQRVCQPNGKWSGSNVKCLPKKCGIPTSPLNSKITLPCDLSYGSTCPVTCHDGFILRGQQMIKCGFVYGRLQWDKRNTKCEEIMVCNPNPCLNGGRCSIVTDTEYSCNCINTGHTGTNCEQLLFEISPIPKQPIKVTSQPIAIKSSPKTKSVMSFVAEDPDVIFTPSNLTFTRWDNEKKFTLKSDTPGVYWVSFEGKSPNEQIYRTPDQLVFFYDPQQRTPAPALQTFYDDCFSLKVELHSCEAHPVFLTSTKNWRITSSDLYLTNGLMFANISSTPFPLALPKTRSSQLMQDFVSHASLDMANAPSSKKCKERDISQQQLEHIIKNDIFSKEFVTQFNKITPSWFSLVLDQEMKNIHENNIRAYIWSAHQVQSHPVCGEAAIDETSTYLVYLLHGTITMKVYDKSVTMTTKSAFCILIDMCKKEPHFAFPSDNFGHLENMFAFSNVQTVGWKLSLKSIGFRSGDGDSRKCSKAGVKQVLFGSTKMTYNFKNIVKGNVSGVLTYDVVQKIGREELEMTSQCFEGKSKVETTSWMTTDTSQQKYVKTKKPRNRIRTKTRQPTTKDYMLTLVQGENSIFQMKSGLKPVLKKAPKSNAYLDFIFKKKTSSSSSGGGSSTNVDTSGIELLEFPVQDLDMYLNDLLFASPKEPLLTTINTFLATVTKWNTRLTDDLNQIIWGDKFGDNAFILKSIQYNYYQVGPALTKTQAIITGIKRDSALDQNIANSLQLVAGDLKTALDELKKHVSTTKPTKEFAYLTVHFNSSVCLFSPCITNVDTTMFPFKYDLGLGGLCKDTTKSPFDIWQTVAEMTSPQSVGKFFHFQQADQLHLCLTVDGVKVAKITTGIELLDGQIHRETYLLQDKQMSIGKQKLTLFGKYEFEVNSTVDFELKAWDKVNVKSYGKATDNSGIITDLQKLLDRFTVGEYTRLNQRQKESFEVKKRLQNLIKEYQVNKNTNQTLVQQFRTELSVAENDYRIADKNATEWRQKYQNKRDEMKKLEQEMNKNCTLQQCPRSCHKLQKCKVCQDPYQIPKQIPSCKEVLVDRRYGFEKSEKSVCSHVVTDWKTKYTGNCEKPGPDPTEAQRIIDRINGKLQKNESLTLEDAIDLEYVSEEKGKQLREQIQRQTFFKYLPLRLQNQLLTDDDFKKIEEYTKNKTLANELRQKMKDIKNSHVLQKMVKKMSDGQKLTEADYKELRDVNKTMAKEIRKSELVGELMEKIRLLGNITEEDLAKLREIAPEYAKNLTAVLEKQDVAKKMVDSILKKMSKGTLSPDDLTALEKVNPQVAGKLKEALKEQLKQKVKEMQKKMKSVKGTLETGLNNTGFTDLQKQLNMLSGSLKTYDRAELEKLQKKIQSNNETSGNVFEETFERLDLAYDIKKLTGNSKDLKRVLDHFFAVLPKFDVPMILQRSGKGFMEGFDHLQQWFETNIRILQQSCDRCQKNCTTPTLVHVLLGTKQSLGKFEQNICRTKWVVGYRTKKIDQVCVRINGMLKVIDQTNCDIIKSQILTPINDIVELWKEVRIDVDEMKKDQWKRSSTSIQLFKEHQDFFKTLTTTFSQELGSIQLKYHSEEDIISQVERLLAGKKVSTNLAEIHSLLIVIQDIIQALEKLPNLVSRNGQSNVHIDSTSAQMLIQTFRNIFNKIIPELQELCTDKQPLNPTQLSRLIVGANAQFKVLTSATDNDRLMLYTQRVGQFTKYLMVYLNKELDGLKSCTLRQDVKSSSNTSSWTNEALSDLKEFLNNVKPLEKKTIQDLAQDLRSLIDEYSNGGIESPIGKLMDLAEDFMKQSPEFNIPVMISFSPKISTIALNTFQEYITTALDILKGMKSIVKKCKNGKCTPQDVFGQSKLSKVFDKFDKYMKPISKYAANYAQKINKLPKGFQTLISSLEQVQTSLKTFSESGTGFSRESLDDVIEALDDVIKAVAMVKKNLKGNFDQMSSLKNTDIKDIVQNIKDLRTQTISLYNGTKVYVLKENIESVTIFLREIETNDLDADVSALERRAELTSKISKVVKRYGQVFGELYSLNLPALSVTKIDNEFAPSVAVLLGKIKRSLQKISIESNEIGQQIGLDLPNVVEDSTDFAQLISDMRSSAGARKTRLAKDLSDKSSKVDGFFDRLSDSLKEKYKSFMGGISKYKKKYEELKKKMKKYGEMFDEVQVTVKALKDKPLSKIGEIKDATEDLIDELKTYDLSLIITADPTLIPGKVSEMKELFTSLSGAFKEMDIIMRNCTSCKVDKIFGYRFLQTVAVKINDAFEYMLTKLEKVGHKIGSSIHEVQQMQKVADIMKKRFRVIKESGQFNLQTLKDLSQALDFSTQNISSIQHHAENLVEILLNRDVDLDIVGNNINKVVNMLSDVMNRSYQVGQRGKKVYHKALHIQNKFQQLKNKSNGIKSGPLGARLDIAKTLAEDSKAMLKELPEIFKLSKDTLNAAGIDGKWLNAFGENVERITNSLISGLSKTGQVLEAADITIEGINDIEKQLPNLKSSWKQLNDASWDQKIPALQEMFKQSGSIFDQAVSTTIKGANALNYSLTRNDLTEALQKTVGKERLLKYKNLFSNVSRMLNQLQNGPISNVGKLTDSVESFVDALEGYDFGKMLMTSPGDLRNKLTEFQQLAMTTGDIIKDIGRISGECQGCDITNIFGKRFKNSFSAKLKEKFGGIKKSFVKIADRVDTGLGGWEKMLSVTDKLTKNFDGIHKDGFTRQSFDDISEALRKSADDIIDLKNGTSDIFQAIFDGDKDMEFLKNGFEGLVHKVSGVLNKTSVVLPKAGEVYDSVNKVKNLFGEIGADMENVNKGPIESRLEVLKNIGKGVNAIGKTLPLIFDQSSDVLVTLGVNGSWFRKVSGGLWDVSQKLSNVVNKTDTLLTGAGLIVKDVRNMQGITRGIQQDYQKILKAPWNQKFNILNEALGKTDQLVQSVTHSASIFDKTIQDVIGVDLGIDDNLGELTNGVSGFIGNISEAVKKLADVSKDITSTINRIQSGPVEKIGKLTDSTKEFVDNLKNYDIGEILLISPKFAKEKFADLKEIVFESGAILKNISSLIKKHCKSCDFTSIFGKDFSSDVLGGIGKSLKNITIKVEAILDKVEDGAASAAGIYQSVKGIKEEVGKLEGIGFDEDGFAKVADVLHTTSDYIQDIRNDSSNIFRLLFDGNNDLMKISKRFESFVNDFGSFIESAGNFSSNVADAFDEVAKIKKTFRETLENIDDLTEGPIENRVKAVQNIVTGVNSMMKAVPDLLKNSPLSPQWLRGFGTKLDGITSGIAGILNKTSEIAGGIGETITNVQQIGQTASIIGNEFKRMLSAGTVDGKIEIAKNIVSKISTLTTQVNSVTNNVTDVLGILTGKVFKNTDIFGAGTDKLLNDISSGLNTIADRYTKFTELSKSLNDAFDKLEDDPVKFALEELPIIFNQTAHFVSLLYKDVQGVADKLGINLEKYNLDTKLVKSAKSFFKFADSALGTIGSGKKLIDDFKSLLNSKDFKEALTNFDNVVGSGEKFLTSVDKLGQTLFKNWGNIKGELTDALNDVASSLGVNLKDIGSALSKGLAVGRNVLSIASNIESLLKMKEFNAETIAEAANSVVSIMKSGIEIAQQFGVDVKSLGLEQTSQVLGTVTTALQIVKGVKDFMDWLDGACDLTWKTYPVSRNVTYVCLQPKLQIENAKVLIEQCHLKNITVTRGYGEAKLCCPTSECVFMQDVKCVYQNEQCSTHRRLFVEQSKDIDESSRNVFLQYDKHSAIARAKQMDVRTGQIKLNRAMLKLNRSIAILERAEKTLDKLGRSQSFVNSQLNQIKSLVVGSKSTLLIKGVEFEIVQYSPDLTNLPLRISMLDINTQQQTFIDIAINTKQIDISFQSVIKTIVHEAVDYTPLTNKKRRRRSATPFAQHSIVEEKRNATYWSHTCASYNEGFNMLKTILQNLNKDILDMRTNDIAQPTDKKLTGINVEAIQRLQQEIGFSNQGSVESIGDVIQRWQRSSEGVLTEDVGASCFDFKDCVKEQIDVLKDLYEPTMQNYRTLMHSFDTIRNLVNRLIAKKLSKSQLVKINEDLSKEITNIERKTFFCEEEDLVMTEEMPLLKFAYLEEAFELDCTIDGPAGMSYSWTRNGSLLPSQNNYKLSIGTVRQGDQGVYVCHGQTITNKLSSNQVLVRIAQPIKFHTQPRDYDVKYPGGKNIEFLCNATSPSSRLTYKWWFRANTSPNKQLISQSSILNVRSVRSSNIGHYWCEATDGQTIVTSRTARVNIIRVIPRKEIAKISMSVIKTQEQWRCQLPQNNNKNITSLFQAKFNNLFGFANTLKLNYRVNSDGKASLNIGVGSRKNIDLNRNNELSFALKVSTERAELKKNVRNVMSKGTENSLNVNMGDCIYQTVNAKVLWRTENELCPAGMATSQDNVYCVQCGAGTFDGRDDRCLECPFGTYQPRSGQMECIPCGEGRSTGEKGATNQQQCVTTNFNCKETFDLIVLLDSSDDVSSETWIRIKRFASNYVQRMNREFVNIDFIVFGSRVKFIDSSKVNDVLQLDKLNGGQNFHDAIKMAEKTLGPSNSRKVVLTVTENLREGLSEMTEKVLHKMKSDGFEMYSVVLKNNKDASKNDFELFTSRPLGRHSFAVHQNEVPDWSTVVAMETCQRRSL